MAHGSADNRSQHLPAFQSHLPSKCFAYFNVVSSVGQNKEIEPDCPVILVDNHHQFVSQL